jgi:hypothetical protein
VAIAFVNDAKDAYPKGYGAPTPSNFFTTDTVKVKCNAAFYRYFSTRERNCEVREHSPTQHLLLLLRVFWAWGAWAGGMEDGCRFIS